MASFYVDLYRELADQISAALGGITVVKGFPSWAQPTLVLPSAAILLESDDMAPPSRIGQGNRRRQLTWRIVIYAKHEMSLLETLEALDDWLRATDMLTITSCRVDVLAVASGRQESLSGAQQEEYAFYRLIQTEF